MTRGPTSNDRSTLMARIRTIKPDFFLSRSLARVSRDARLTFAGLWVHADDKGRGLADPRLLKGSIWPLDDDITPEVVHRHLESLAAEHIDIYAVDGEAYFQVRNWVKHQAAAYTRGEAKYPEPPPSEPGTELHNESCKKVLEQGKEGNKERKGARKGPATSRATPARDGMQPAAAAAVDLYIAHEIRKPRSTPVGDKRTYGSRIRARVMHDHGAALVATTTTDREIIAVTVLGMSSNDAASAAWWVDHDSPETNGDVP